MSNGHQDRPIFINENYLKSEWKCRIKRLDTSKLRKITKDVIIIQGVIQLVVPVVVPEPIVKNLAVNVLLERTYIDKYI